MADKYLKFSQLKAAGVMHSRGVLTEMIKCGGFPRPKFQRNGEDVWRLNDVVAWLAEPSRSWEGYRDEPWMHPTKSDWVQPGRGV
jgi:hypothetical protein